MNDPHGPRIVAFAYQEVGYVCLQTLIRRGANVVAVFTHRDAEGENIWFRSVAGLAADHGIPVHLPDGPDPATVRRLSPDLILSFYYRDLIGEEILALAPLGAFNMHGSLLPRYRGRAPVNWAVVRGEPETGVTLHHMTARADAGPIVDQEAVPIGPRDSIRVVYERVVAAAAAVLDRQLANLLAGTAPARPQDESLATYCRGRTPEDGRIDWNAPAREVFNLIRGVTHPYPGAFTLADGRRLYIWWGRPEQTHDDAPGRVTSIQPLRIACGQGSLQVDSLQWEGACAQRADDSTHGLYVGQQLGAAGTHH
ncbi:MAG TPA: formyltransferase [Gammaproteobacteria bacterium]|nr:formyltransferase [Gammaproteobacteria bacterium]